MANTLVIDDPDSTELEDYQKWVAFTASETAKNDLRWAVLGLVAEAGEVAGVVEKSIRKDTFATYAQYDDLSKKVMDELGDVLWFAAATCNVLGITLDDVILHNIEKINERQGISKS